MRLDVLIFLHYKNCLISGNDWGKDKPVLSEMKLKLTSSETESRHSTAADFFSSSVLTPFFLSDLFRPFPLLRPRDPAAGEELVVGDCSAAALLPVLAVWGFLQGGKNCASQCSTSLGSSCCRMLSM